jgi:hypothetical protein
MLPFTIGALTPLAAFYLMGWRWAATSLSLAAFCAALVVIFSPAAFEDGCADSIPCAVSGVSTRLQAALALRDLGKITHLQGS